MGLYKLNLPIGSFKLRFPIGSFKSRPTIGSYKTRLLTRKGMGQDFFFSHGVEWDRRENPLPCRPLPPTPPRRRHALNLISRSPIHGPHADYISRLFLLAITAADAVADCSEPPSGKSSHPAPSPKRTCSVLTRGSSHPNGKKLTCRCATRTSGETIN